MWGGFGGGGASGAGAASGASSAGASSGGSGGFDFSMFADMLGGLIGGEKKKKKSGANDADLYEQSSESIDTMPMAPDPIGDNVTYMPENEGPVLEEKNVLGSDDISIAPSSGGSIKEKIAEAAGPWDEALIGVGDSAGVSNDFVNPLDAIQIQT
jgi:hypothetical protein